jgi:hypothetical protein
MMLASSSVPTKRRGRRLTRASAAAAGECRGAEGGEEERDPDGAGAGLFVEKGRGPFDQEDLQRQRVTSREAEEQAE